MNVEWQYLQKILVDGIFGDDSSLLKNMKECVVDKNDVSNFGHLVCYG